MAVMGWQGCGIVEFASSEEAAKAIEQLDESMVCPSVCHGCDHVSWDQDFVQSNSLLCGAAG